MTSASEFPGSPTQNISRRRFLRSTLAAGATASSFGVLRSHTAEEPAPAPDKPIEFARKIKLGVVGCGGRGSCIARLFQRHGGYEMLAVADYFQAAADKSGDALGGYSSVYPCCRICLHV